MSILTEDELESLREVVSRPRMPDDAAVHERVREYPLIHDQSDTTAAMSALEGASVEMAHAIEQTLSTRTRRPWTVVARQPHKAELAEFVTTLPQPVLGVWESRGEPCGFLMVDRGTAQALVLSMLGVETGAAPPAGETLGAIDKKVIARLMGSLSEQLVGAFAEVGIRIPAAARLHTDWRKVGAATKDLAFIVVPIEIREPIEGRIDIVVSASFVAPGAPGHQPTTDAKLADHLPGLELDVVAELGRIEMTLDALSRLHPGKVLLLGAESAPLRVLVGGEPRFRGWPDGHAGRLMLTLVGGSGDERRPPPPRKNLLDLPASTPKAASIAARGT